jgi:hypothetical protein
MGILEGNFESMVINVLVDVKCIEDIQGIMQRDASR